MIQETATELDQAEQEPNLLLIGDFLIDETWFVKASKLSPEGPVPVAYTTDIVPIKNPGGAGLAASFAKKNIEDANVIFFTATSNETAEWLKSFNIDIRYSLLEEKNVIKKIRYIDKTSKYHLLRIDTDLVAGEQKIDYRIFSLNFYKIREKGLSGIVLLDYRKGIFRNKRLVNKIITIAKENKIPVYVDSRDENIYKFKGANWIKLNLKEYNNALKVLNCDCPKEIIELMELDGLIITKGEEGAELYMKDTNLYYDYKAPINYCSGSPDVTGCGDVFDIMFAYNKFAKKETITDSLIKAVNKATLYAHQPIENRLC
jgi:D-beta-D-heptose 7-phosphate kinase/D-beta-D-heptose 1-phosphate adenosyltransferase